MLKIEREAMISFKYKSTYVAYNKNKGDNKNN